MNEYILPLDPSKRSTDTLDFQTALRQKSSGRRKASRRWWTCIRFSGAGLNSPGVR